MMKKETVTKLRRYVEEGGTLISEGLPAYFGDEGRAGPAQPNYGLEEVFGARERYVEFTPDLLEKLSLRVRGERFTAATSSRNTRRAAAVPRAIMPTATSRRWGIAHGGGRSR